MNSDTPALKPEENLAAEITQPASVHTRACQAAQRLHSRKFVVLALSLLAAMLITACF
ncbi:MAG: hypothetical protein WCK66_14405 [Betaproteobacteria bacterium]|jgi:hypothetical protein